ncbi:hypothetical protein F2Q69_00028072 [Brassica cretica]|uniref:Ubiquitin-fold modifier-conjugating enzyme 1 n=2 Tax=Brassica TaxID=3705 RepID=A0A0D3CE17_BRAOL|nr:hypothetical protein F2Q69_00028072 [Brassica cretica]
METRVQVSDCLHPDEQVQLQRLVPYLRLQPRGHALDWQVLVCSQPPQIRIRSPELELPEIDGKTQKMYRGGKICLTVHFKPLWAKNCPTFGIAHALCLGLAPSMACCRDSNSCGLRHD